MGSVMIEGVVQLPKVGNDASKLSVWGTAHQVDIIFIYISRASLLSQVFNQNSNQTDTYVCIETIFMFLY